LLYDLSYTGCGVCRRLPGRCIDESWASPIEGRGPAEQQYVLVPAVYPHGLLAASRLVLVLLS
jgi:hypothetical protein